MGNSISSWGGQKKVQSLIDKAGLPLQIARSAKDEQEEGPLSPFTEAYPAAGWFTGVKSNVTMPIPPADVYQSLSKDLHKVFSSMTECLDEIQEDDGEGMQRIFRIVRIPFKVAFVTGNLKLRLHVKQDRNSGKINFESAKEGRLITRFMADFEIASNEDGGAIVNLDAKISAKSLPPPPFKGMVKDVMVRKMDRCMVDLVEYHARRKGGWEEGEPQKTKAGGGGGLLAGLRRSFSRSRSSLNRRPSLEAKPVSFRDSSQEHILPPAPPATPPQQAPPNSLA